MHVLMFEEFGDADVLQWREVGDLRPGSNEALVRIEAAGLNFADIYRRRGRWRPAGNPPWINGYEGAGVIEELGPQAEAAGFRAGDRIGFADSPAANAEFAVVATDKLIPLPDGITTKVAAAVLLQGLTAHYLTCDSHPLKAGEWVVVHAAGGGVGLLLVQIAKRLGAHVIGTASSPEKRAAAKAAGADHAIEYENWVAEVRQLTDGGANVVYDSIGATLNDSLGALRQHGRAVFYGMAGGDPPAVDPRMLMENSLSVTGGDLWNVLVSGDERRRRAEELFSWMLDGSVCVKIAKTFSLADGASAHRLLESRIVSGKILLIPNDGVM
ncbi:MAG TPA: quinone oxidoreductase [Allosphingosinicella sp.]|uniref:quinone oxidoreductase family protein n=1 Tax=Allosphingosinicella sp. TaxID=2823234 RepID=UPI002ED8214A